jgi:hypothetical protein
MARELSWVQYAAENVDDQNHSSVLIVFIAAGCVFALFVLLRLVLSLTFLSAVDIKVKLCRRVRRRSRVQAPTPNCFGSFVFC